MNFCSPLCLLRHHVMMHPAAKDSRKFASPFLFAARGVHHSALWCWNYMGGNPICEPGRVFLQISPKDSRIRPHFEGKEKDPPYLGNVIKIIRASGGSTAESEGTNALCRMVYWCKGARGKGNRQMGNLPSEGAAEREIKPVCTRN